MSRGEDAIDFDPAYVAGLLDATARVRFDASEQQQGEFSLRPMLRIKPHDSDLREAAIGRFLDARDYTYDFVERDYGAEFFRLQQRSDLDDLRDYLAGESAHLIRELEFVGGPFRDEYDFELLSPRKFCRFLVTRDELRYGWRPRGRYHRVPSAVAKDHDVSLDTVAPDDLPEGDVRDGYTPDYVGGVVDGLCRYRPAISEALDTEVGFEMYPVARLHRNGVHPAFVDYLIEFADGLGVSYGDSSSENELLLSFSGVETVHRFVVSIFDYLLVLAECSQQLVNEVLPGFAAERDHSKQGFYDLLCEFEELATASGGPYRGRRFDPEYFASRWQNEIDVNPTHVSEAPQDTSDVWSGLGPVALAPEMYGTDFGRYGSIESLDSVGTGR